MSRKPQVKVTNYTTAGAMEKDIAKMLADGWRVVGQVGELSPYWTTSFLKRRKATVTYIKDVVGGQ